MKKLMLILIGAFICASVMAQVTARTAVQHVLSAKKTYYEYTGVAADTCGTEQDTLYFEIEVNKNTAVNCNARIEVTRTGSTETYSLDLYGKVFENDSWTAIVQNAGATASATLSDTCGITSAGLRVPANFFRYYRVFVDNDGTCGAADKLTVDKVYFKVYER